MSEIELKKLEILEREAHVKEQELEHQIAESKKGSWKSPLVVAIFVAAISVLGNALITYYSAYLDRRASSTEYERQVVSSQIDAERERILEMIKIGDPKQVQQNLEFLIDAKLVIDGKTVTSIKKYYENRDPRTGPGKSYSQLGNSGRFSPMLLFDNGKTLTYTFLEKPTVSLKEAVKEATIEWMKYANISFQETNDISAAIIRIMPSEHNSSMVGAHALAVPIEKPTMHLVNKEKYNQKELATILHEFGHVLGMVHEHQNPRSQISWDIEAAYSYFREQFGFSSTLVDRNIFEKSDIYPCIREFDPNSIMMLEIPPEITADKLSLGGAIELSDSDKRCVASMYPK